MLDFKLIEQGTAHARTVLNALPSCAGTVQVFTKLFPEQLLAELLDYCKSASWQPAFNREGEEIKYRKKISFEHDTVLEVSHTVLENVTDDLSKLFDKQLTFNGIDLWKDTEHYAIGPHTDNPMFNASLQMYIQNLPYLSTVFESTQDCQSNIWTDTAPGSGYIADNTNGLTHWLNGIVPANYNRYSLHATWT